jgi:hypothetical protein
MTNHSFVVPRIGIEDDQELRVTIDIDPDGNRALRLEVHRSGSRRGKPVRGPLWINLRALQSLQPDFAFSSP